MHALTAITEGVIELVSIVIVIVAGFGLATGHL
jgi:hypothetical protein